MSGLRVWWTIPASDVAWSWQPEVPLLVDAVGVVEDGVQYLVPVKPIIGAFRTYTPQSLADLTALFAQEANLVPSGLIITWLAGSAAVRWDRGADHWTRHGVTPREHGPAVCLSCVPLEAARAPSVRESYGIAGELLRLNAG